MILDSLCSWCSLWFTQVVAKLIEIGLEQQPVKAGAECDQDAVDKFTRSG
jgi:hypothetical protein